MSDGAEARMLLPALGLGFEMVTRHRDAVPGQGFRSVQVQGPFRRWDHSHRFLAHDSGHSTVEDRIDFDLPARPLGPALCNTWMLNRLERAFHWRHQRTHHDLTHLAPHWGAHMRVAVSGASGGVGGALVPFLGAGGCDVRRIVRTAPDSARGDIFWDQEHGTFESSGLEGLDAVVHLAGASIAGARWSAGRKRTLVSSRVDSTHHLAQTLAQLKQPPRVFVAASAIGFYGSRAPEDEVTEASPAGTGFLPQTCRDWEAATEPAERAGIRVVHLRIGVVLSRTGGILAALRRPFGLGLGGRVGNGAQVLSWIALDDLLGVIRLAMTEPLQGPVNAVAPNPLSNREFAAALGEVMKRPAVLPMPALAVRAALGEMGRTLMLEGVRVRPTVLERAGFKWCLPDVRSAFRFELGLPAD